VIVHCSNTIESPIQSPIESNLWKYNLHNDLDPSSNVDRRKSVELSEEEIKAAAQRRYHIAEEILTTEKSYVHWLELTVKIFLQPLRYDLNYKEEFVIFCRDKERGMLSFQQIRTIFADIETIVNYQKILLEDLEGRTKDWSEETRLGEVFTTMVRYSQDLLDSIEDSMVIL
jgi:hypothetical protein